jgi:tetratricopeptide (TPR) repeat protein
VGEGSVDELERKALTALPVLEAADDHRGLADVWLVLGYAVANTRCRFEDFAQASEQAIRHARLAHHQRTRLDRLLYYLPIALVSGPRPAQEALATLDAFLSESEPLPRVLGWRAILLAMLDRIEEADELISSAEARWRELGQQFQSASHLSDIAQVTGDEEGAVEHLRRLCDYFAAGGSRAGLSTAAPRLGRVLAIVGRDDEAEPLAEQGRALGDPQDVLTQACWRQAQALVLASRAQHAEAESLVREAVEIAERTDSPHLQGDAYCDLAQVLEAAGRRREAADALREALDRYERKQVLPLARRVRERLSALTNTPD